MRQFPPLREQHEKEQSVVRRVHDGGRPGGTGRLAHPTEGRARQRDQYGVAPRVAVFLEMQQPERNPGHQNARMATPALVRWIAATVQSLGCCAGPLGAKQIEHLYIGSNQDTSLLTVAQHRRVEEVAIQSA